MAKRDCYEILGVSKDAPLDQIKKSYRQSALKYHPDRNPGDKEAEDKFKEASEAYQILSNEDSRAKYDRFGYGAFNGASGFEGFGDFSSVFSDDFFSDIFGSFFGQAGARSTSRVRSGRDLRYQLEITLEEAATGVEKKISIKRPVPCDACSGSRCRDGAQPEACRHCGGNGQIRQQHGFFTMATTCPICRGEGKVVSDPCPSCGGAGAGTKLSEIVVKVPLGIDHGQRLKLRNEGEVISDGPAGDLYVEIAIKPHDFFHRRDAEIICEVPITYSQAALGGEIEVPTLSGDAKLKIPAGTPSGKVFRLRGKGIGDLHGRKGDQHVRTFIYVPQSVVGRERDLLTELAQVEGKPTAHETRSFLDKFKEFFE